MAQKKEKTEPDYKPEEYQEMQRRLRKLKETIEAGKFHADPSVADGLKESLSRVRYKGNGDIDLDTVDGRVRSIAFLVTTLSDRQRIKELNPLKEIQHAYFEYVEKSFGDYHEAMKARGLTPHQAGLIAARGEESREYFRKVAPKFLESIKLIWSYVNEPCRYHLEDLRCLKGVFSGDIQPSYTHNIASSCGLYLDTILLPDPFLKMGPLLGRWNDSDRAYYFMKHAMILLNYKELALADVDPPIVAIVPDAFALDKNYTDFIRRMSEGDAAKHASMVFDKHFASFPEFAKFASKIETIDQAVSAIRLPNRLLFDEDWKDPLADQIKRAIEQDARAGIKPTVGQMLALQCFSRMSQANDALYRSQQFHGIPLIDAPTSWKYLTWKLEYDNRTAHGVDWVSTQIVAGLQDALGGEMQWLGNVPLSALIELRKTGGIEEVRSILRKGVSDLESMDETAFKNGASAVVQNLKSAFAAHEEAMKKLRAKAWKFAGTDVGSWLAIGAVEVVAAATGAPLFGVGAYIANQIFNVPKLNEVVPKAKALKREIDEKKRSPVGLLFMHKKMR
jgi:hypothetical protein